MPRQRLVWFLLAAQAVFVSCTAQAGDWPQFLGPNRNGTTAETGLLKNWPKGGPKLKWKVTNLGDGLSYSAPAVVKGRVYVMAALGMEEHVFALDEKDGSKIWSTKIGTVGANPAGAGNYHPGPRGTPTVEGDFLYALCSGGEIACVGLAKGNKVWSKNLRSDFSGKPGSWAYAESPLVDGDAVIVSPGGTSSPIVALKKKDGSVLWKSAVTGKGGKGGPNAAYGSPIVVEVGGVKQYVSVLNSGLVGVAASDGKFLWRFDKPSNKQGINIATPLFHDGLVFNTSGYNSGGGVVKLAVNQGKVSATESWFETDLTSAHAYGGFIRVGEHLYGTAAAGKGGKGGGSVQLVCVELKTGKIVWKNTCVGAQSSVCMADGMLYVRGQNGKVALVEAKPAGYKEHGRFDQPNRGKEPAWPYPVVANGCLYLRDLPVLLCYDVQEPNK